MTLNDKKYYMQVRKISRNAAESTSSYTLIERTSVRVMHTHGSAHTHAHTQNVHTHARTRIHAL